jgi:predicted Zn-dependent protease
MSAHRSWPWVAVIVLAGSLGSAAPLHAHEDLDEEIEEATASIAARKGDAAAYVWRAELRRLDRNWEGAQADLDEARRLAPRRDDLALSQAALDLDRGRATEAVAGLGAYLARHPDEGMALRLRARAWKTLGRLSDERADLATLLARAKEVRPDDVRDLARAVRGIGGPIDSTIAVYDRGIRRLGSLVSLEIPAMDLEVEAGRYDAALARLDRIAPQYERRFAVLERRGELLARAGRIAEARAARAAARAERESSEPDAGPLASKRGARVAAEPGTAVRAAGGER